MRPGAVARHNTARGKAVVDVDCRGVRNPFSATGNLGRAFGSSDVVSPTEAGGF